MIEAKFGLVAGVKQVVRIDNEWNVDTADGPVVFSTEMGPLVVATVMENFDRVTTKQELKNLTSLTYRALTREDSDQQFESIEKPPEDYTQKELGDVFDAFVRRRSFPLRENVYHIGKLSFRKLLFVQYPADFDLVESIITDIDIATGSDEDYIRESYFRTYYDKYHLLHGGTKKGIRKTRSSDETIVRLNEKLVEVRTRATRRNEIRNSDNEGIEARVDSAVRKTALENVKTPVYSREIKPRPVETDSTPSPVESYEPEIRDYVEQLENGSVIELANIISLVRKIGLKPNPVDIESVILRLAKNAKIRKTLAGKNMPGNVVYIRFNKK